MNKIMLLLWCTLSLELKIFHSYSLNFKKIPVSSLIRCYSIKLQRIERIISGRGVGSRKEASEMIKRGRVSVDNKIIKSSALKLPINSKIYIDGIELFEIPLLAVYNKPVGIHSTIGDPWNRPNLLSAIITSKEEYSFLKYMHPVGRLDADTSGLLLFSKDGQLTQYLLNPNNKIPRVYEAIVIGDITKELGLVLKQQLNDGVVTSDGKFSAQLIEAFSMEQLQTIIKYNNITATDDSITHMQSIYNISRENIIAIMNNSMELLNQDKAISNDDIKNNISISTTISCVKLSCTEGKYRMIRRILHNSGYSVLHLHRISYGSIILSGSNTTTITNTTAINTSTINTSTINTTTSNTTNNSVDKLSLVVPSGSLEVCNIDQLNWAASLKYQS